MVIGLAACAEPTPTVKTTASDVTATASAGTDQTAQPAASESAEAAVATETVAPSGEPPDAASASASTSGSTADAVETRGSESAKGEVAAAAGTEPASPPPATTTQAPAALPATQATVAGGSELAPAGPPGSGLATGRPYVVIRFTESSVDYERPLAEAVKRAVERKANVAFDLVAVTPRASTAEDLADETARARAQAAAVMKSLNGMGISADRVNMAAWTGQATDVNEIRLYIR
jgi:hypothetical protein